MKTISQKAKELKITRQGVWKRIKAGKIKAKKIGCYWIVFDKKK